MRSWRAFATLIVLAAGVSLVGAQLASGSSSTKKDIQATPKHRFAKPLLTEIEPLGEVGSVIARIGPPGGVFTCEWIATHPTEATAFSVSCDASMNNSGADLVRAAELRAEIEQEKQAGFRVLSDGNDYVPSVGCVSPGVYAASGFQYTTHWSWTSGGGETFYWYVKRTDDSIADNGVSFGGAGGTRALAANVYRWQVYNAGSGCYSWFVVWNDD